MPYTIYRVTNLDNGKLYIGRTGRTVQARWKSHLSASRSGSTLRLHEAIRKLGELCWKQEIISEVDDFSIAKLLEEDAIRNERTQEESFGYNATPGATGGWIVPQHKLASWKKKQSENKLGLGNVNAGIITNDEIIALAIAFTNEFGFIPGQKRLRDYGEDRGIHVPKSFTKFRFGGTYGPIAAEVEKSTGLTYNAYYRDPVQNEKIRAKRLGQKWYHNDAERRNKLLFPETVDCEWNLGRKIYD